MRFFLCLFLMFVASLVWPEGFDAAIEETPRIKWALAIAAVFALLQDLRDLGP